MRIFLLLLVLLAASAPGLATERLTVAAAADLTFALHDVAERFEQQTGNAVGLSFGSSGNFFSQIQNGAPFDLFFSADLDYPKKLESLGLTEPGSLYQYARGRLVLWAPKDSRLDLSRGLQILLDPAVRKIAIANPEHAPYGRAAVAALQHEGIYDQVRARLVLGESVSQAAQFVVSGGADVGLLAQSLTLAPGMKGKSVEVPASSYPPIDQAAVILKSSRNKAAARQFLQFLRKPEILEVMRRYGFEVPEGSGGAAP